MSYSTKKILKLSGWVFLILIAGYYSPRLLGGAFGFIVPALLLFTALLLKGNLLKWIRGDEAEMDIGDELNKLPDGFYSLGSLIIKEKCNIDYVVIGPTGIWAIEVKSHRGLIRYNNGELTLNGRPFEKNFLKQAYAEAYAVRDILKEKLNRDFYVQPVLVFSRAKPKFGYNKVEGIYIIGIKWLVDLIKKALHRLDEQTIFQVKEILKQYCE